MQNIDNLIYHVMSVFFFFFDFEKNVIYYSLSWELKNLRIMLIISYYIWLISKFKRILGNI